ncbi:beta strand repeat-containing protein [Aureitalea marina]|uniref:DUF7507 domain-containing protein n=1 Tax=Aureitalea marina TaxID=930804 RepID=A0A2S7KQA7_9FLAO|nr:SprB repeat-containing protein [Aureitalea marina]PQB04812.1 hypothetical protein BST85_07800 [Aureitalea marina]
MNGNAILNINEILVISNGDLTIESSGNVVNITTALLRLPNGNVTNKAGTINFIDGAVQICDNNYKDETTDNSVGTFGTGYIYARNGNIENVNANSGFFSNTINWCTANGNGVNLPIPENCGLINPQDCNDEGFYLTLLVPEDDPTIIQLCQRPEIALVKEAEVTLDPDDGCVDIAVDGTINYKFTLTNQGNVSISAVVLEDTFLGGVITGPASGDADNDNKLDVTETWIYTASHTVTQDDIEAGEIENTATATGEAPNGDAVGDVSGATVSDDDPTITPICQDPAIALVKEADVVLDPVNGCVAVPVDGTINYIFTVTNQGDVELSNIVLDDPLVANAAYDSGDDGDGILQLDETWIYLGSYQVTQSDLQTGSVTNTATVSGESIGETVEDTSGATISDDDETITPVCQEAVIALLKTGELNDDNQNGCLEPGESITYTFTLSNEGNVTVSSVGISDPLLNALLTVPNSGDDNDNDILDVGETWIFTANYNLTQTDLDAGQVLNTATASGMGPGNAPVSDDSHPTDITLDGETTTSFDTCPIIDAVDDSAGPLAGVNVEIEDVLNVFDNDTFNGSPVDPQDVTLTETVAEPNGYLELNSDGSVDVAANTPPGQYQLTYQICSVDYPDVCDTAVVTVTVVAPVIIINAQEVCDNDTPYLDFTVTLDNFTSNEDLVVEWLDSNNQVVQTDIFPTNGNTIISDRILWPGAEVDGQGNPTDWPGWEFVGGVWIETDDGFLDFRPTATVRFSINPTQTIQVSYPPSSPFCVTGPRLDADFTQVDVLCTDDATGQIDVTVSGGVAPFTFAWSTNDGSGIVDGQEDQTGLTAGTYTVLITDFIGLTKELNITITEPAEAVTATITTVNATAANNCSDGSATVNPSGGTGDYTYQWSASAGSQTTATATDLPTGSHSVTVTDENGCEFTDTITISCNQPGIALVKVADVTLNPNGNCVDITVNGSIDYIFTVTNTGNVPLSSVQVTDPKVSPINFVSGDTNNDGFLDTNETWTYGGSYTVDQDDIDVGEVVNQAEVTAIDDLNQQVDDTSGTDASNDTETVTPICTSASIALIKTADVQADPQTGCVDLVVGSIINYSFTVTNTGNVTLTNVVVSDNAAGVVLSGGPIASLAPGAVDNTTYSATYEVTQADIDAGTFSNQAMVTGTPPSGPNVTDDSDDDSNLEDDPTVTPICTSASIALIKTSDFTNFDNNGNCIASVGDVINYTFSIRNTGNTTLTNVTVVDNTPGVVLVGSPIASLDPGEEDTTTYTATYVITQDDLDAGQFTNQASVSGTPPSGQDVTDQSDDDSYTENEPTVTPICNLASIAVIKTGVLNDENGDQCSDPQETITYTFTVSNEGTVTLTNVELTDQMLGGIITGPDSGDDNNDGFLQVDEEWIYTADYTITQADIDAGEVSNQAEVVASTTGAGPGGLTNDFSDDNSVIENDPTVTPLCQSASIALIKTADVQADPQTGCVDLVVGSIINYSFTVTNTGNVTLTNVVVSDNAAGVVLVGGPIASLDPGEVDNTTYTASYTVTQADIDAGTFSNQAMVTGTPPSGPNVTDDSDDDSNLENDPTVTPICTSASIALIKTSDFTNFDNNGNCIASVGDVINYTFSIRNTGNTTLTNVTVVDNTPGVVLVGSPIASLDPGEEDTTTYTATYVITQDDLDAGQFTNQASVSGTPPSGQDVTDQSDDDSYTENEPTVTPICNLASIAVIKTGVLNDENGDQCSDPQETITYTFTVSNEGTVTLTNVELTDQMLGGIITGPDSGDDNNDGFLQVDEEWIYTADYTITQADIDAGEVSNQAEVVASTTGAGPGGLTNDFSDDNSVIENDPTVTPLCQSASIALIKTADVQADPQTGCVDLVVGSIINYSFTVTNTGNVTLTNVVVSDNAAGVVLSGGPIASLAPGAVDNTTYSATYEVTQADIDAGTFSNQAMVTGTPPSGPNVTDDSDDDSNLEDDPTVTPICTSASIALIKTSDFTNFDNNGNCIASVGDVINYTFSIRNTGNTTLTNVTVVDNTPGVVLVGSPIASLDPGEEDTTTYTATYVITQDDLDAGQFTNQASVSGTPPSGQDVTDQSDDDSYTENEPTVTPICNLASIAVIKTGVLNDENGDQCSDPQETITYTFTVSNEGTVTLTNVELTDQMLGGIITGPDSGDDNNDGFLQVDEEWIYTADYTITQADIDAGEVSNQAEVVASTTGAGPGGLTNDFSDDNSVIENDPTVTPLCQSASIALIKTADVQADPQTGCVDLVVGSIINYSFTVTNTGNVTLTNVVVSDNAAGVVLVGGPIASLDPGEVDNTTYTASYTVTQADIDAGTFSNQAMVTGTPPSGPNVTDDSDDDSNLENDPTVTPICTSASIALIKTSDFTNFDNNGNCIASVGDVINYTFSIRNTGNTTLTNVTVVDNTPGVVLVGSPIASLDPGEEDTTTYTATYVITQDDLDAGQFTNQASVSGTPPSGQDVTDQSDDDSYTENEPTVTPICNLASIAVIKTGVLNDENGDQCSDPQETITYTFTVSNEGTVTLTNVELTDQMLGGIITGPDSGDDNNDGFLQVDEEWIYTADYTITQADIDAGEVSNQAEVVASTTGAGPGGLTNDFSDDNSVIENDPTVTPLCQSASIALIKTADVQADPTTGCVDLSVGSIINYSFTVTNTGNVTLTNVVVSDNATGVVLSGGPIASLAPNAVDNTTYTATYEVTQADIDAGTFSNQAMVTGTPPSGPNVTDDSDDDSNLEDDPTVTPICTSASIALIKTADVQADPTTGCVDLSVGSIINYSFTVTNTGNVTLTNVVVSDNATGVVLSGGPIASLAPNAVDNTTYTATYEVTQADIDAGTFSNQAMVTGTPPSGPNVTDDSDDDSNLEDDPTVTPICTSASIALIKTADVQADPTTGCVDLSVGSVINYSFTVTNTGNVTLTNVVVSDNATGVVLSGGPIASLAPNAVDNTTYTATYEVTQADIDAGTFSNQAMVTGTPPSGPNVTDDSDDNSNLEDDPTVTPICTSASIALIKTADVQADPTTGCVDLSVGSVINYSFTVTNTGNVTLTNVVVSDNAAGVVLVGGPIASLAPNAVDNTTYTATYEVTQADIDAGTFSNQAMVTGTPPSGPNVTDDSDDNSNLEDDLTVTPICTSASIALIKTADVQADPTTGCVDLSVGSIINYSFTVTNTGNVTLTNVVVSDNATGVVLSGGPIASLAPNAVDNTTYTATYEVTQADIDAGTFSNQAMVTGTPPSGPNVTDDSDDDSNLENDPTVTPICQDAAIALVKTATVDLDPTDNCYDVTVGGLITYRFEVSNQGNVSLDNVVLDDPLVANAAYVSGDAGDDDILGVGEVWIYEGSYAVTQADIDAGSVTNTATVTADDPQDNEVDDTSGATISDDEETVTPICQDAAIALVKTATVDLDPTDNCYDVTVGGLITYRFEVSNQGNVSLDNVVLDDPLVADAAYVSGDAGDDDILGVGEVWIYEGSYAVTQADIDAGSVTNTATVTADDPQDNEVDDTSGATISDDEETVTPICQDAAIALVKTATVDLDPTDNCYDVTVGGLITYRFEVSNQGNVSLDNVVLDDPLVADAAYVSGDAGDDDILGVGEVWIYEGSYAVTQADIDAGSVTNTATVTADDPQDNEVSDTSGATISDDEETVTPICQDAAIALVKTATVDLDPTDNCYDVTVGGLITYRFEVSNQGNVSLDNVVLDDPLVADAAYVSGDAGDDDILGVGEVWIYEGSYAVTQADIDAGSVTNTATVTADDPQDNEVDDTSGATISDDEETVTPICQDAAIALVKTATVDLDPTDNCYDVTVGGLITYRFEVSNQGNVSLDNVVLDDPLVADAAYVSGDAGDDDILGVGEVWIYEGSYAVTQADIDAGSVTNTATVTADDPQDNEVSDTSGATISDDEETVTPICQDAAIALVKTATVDLDPTDNCYDVTVGGLITYRFEVSNQGNVSLDNVVLDDPLVANAAYVSGDAGDDDILGVGEVWIYEGSYAVTQADIDAGSVTNTATVTADDPQDNEVSDTSGATISDDEETVTPICQDAAIALVKTATVDLDPTDNCYDVTVGGLITYRFEVSNQGNVSLDNVVLDDPLVANAAYVSGDAGDDDILGVGEVWIYEGSYAVTQADIDAGSVTNTATVTADDPQDNEVSDTSGATISDDEETVTPICQDAAIALVKTATVDLDPTDNCYDVTVGGLITYRFEVSNQGNVSLDNVVLDDPLVADAAYVSGDAGDDDILGVGEVWIYEGSYAVTQADIDAGSVTNTATVTADDPQDNEVSDTSGATISDDEETVTPICQDAAIALVKTATVDLDPTDNCYDVTVGGLITYRFEVSNQGNVSLDNVVLDDPLVANAAYVSGDAGDDDILGVGEVWIYEGSYAVTQADIDAGSVTNTATVTADDPQDNEVSDTSGATISDDEETVTPICQDAAIALVKTATVDLDPTDNCYDVTVGGLITYRFEVSNQGNVSLDNVVLDDPLVADAAYVSGDAGDDDILGVGEVWIYEGSYAVTQADIDAGSVTNTATVTADDPQDNEVSDTSGATISDDEETITPICQIPVIAIVKTASYEPNGECSAIGDIIDYTFQVYNTGNVTLSNIVVEDPLVGGVISGPNSGDTNNDGLLDIDEVWTYTASYGISLDDIDTGSVSNQATATGTALISLRSVIFPEQLSMTMRLPLRIYVKSQI